jgi:hypothetical protein
MKKFAVFCPVKNETTFSKIWFKYYSQFLSPEDIYFLDFGSDVLPDYCQVKSTDKNILDAIELFEEIKKFHKELLDRYEYVIPTDVDEIVYHKSGLDNFINSLDKDFVKCAGYELIHLPEKEDDFKPNETIFSQRKYWYRSPNHYDKTLITKKPLSWTIGLHNCHNHTEVENDLYLIHLHRFDYKTCIERHLKWASMNWSQETVKRNFNWHYREKELEKLNQWYYKTDGSPTQIPEDILSELNKIIS